MFAQDSERGRPRGQSSWGGDWSGYSNDPSYGRNQSRDNQDDYQRQGFARGRDHEESSSSKVVCQNYLQNKCMRGNNCLFLHPPSSAGAVSHLPPSTNNKRQQNPWLNFCLDFQRGQCPFSDECRLLHVSQRDEADYQSNGDIPAGVVEQAMSKAMVMDWAYIGTQPHCKEYLQGSCTMRGCTYRHLNTDQYVVEVLAALREKFLIPHNEMFQSNTQDKGGFSGNKHGDQYGMGQAQVPSRNMYGDGGNSYGGGGNGYEPDSKRRRGLDFNADDKRLSKSDDQQRGFSQGRESYAAPPARATPDEDFLDVLRRQNISATKTNTEVKKTAHMLEEENIELRKALKLALDLNSHARSLQEFRTHLQDIQITLRKRGMGSDSSSNTAGSWNNRQMDLPSSSQENRMGGDRYSAGMNNAGYGNDRWDMQRSSSGGRYNSSW